MKTKKLLILAVTLSFPVILYLFLRSFGQNTYDLPIFFEKFGENCEQEIYGFNEGDSILLTSLMTHDFNLLIFPSDKRDNLALKNELSRIVQNFEGAIDLGMLTVSYTDFQLSIPDFTIDNVVIGKDGFDQLVNCELKLPNHSFKGVHPTEEVWETNEILVLIDKEGNIRGYYNGFETKEVDRLILEINVLLSK